MQVAAGDAALYVEQHGDGPDLVMLHGMGATSTRVWDGVVPDLARGHRVTTFDLRGHARSTNPSGAQTVAQHAPICWPCSTVSASPVPTSWGSPSPGSWSSSSPWITRSGCAA